MSQIEGDGWDPERVDAISFEKLEKDPNAPLALALMVAANDLYFDLNGNRAYLEHLPDDKYAPLLRQAAAMYNHRLICSRMLECLDLIKRIEQNPYFKQILDQYSSAAEAFERLLHYKKGGNFEKEMQVLERVRNNGSFHYDSLAKLFGRLFKEDYKPYKGNHGLVVIFPENKVFPQRFFVADTLLSALMISRIFPAPGERPQSDEDLQKDYERFPQMIKNFCMDFYKVVMTILTDYVSDLQKSDQD